MYNLITEISNDIELVNYLVEAVKEIFSEDVDELYEGAEHYLGNAIAKLNAGQNPFEGDMPEVDPHVVASLMLLANPENREAFNFSPAKFAVLDNVDKTENVRKFLKQKVGMSASGRSAADRLMQMAAENPKAAARELQKAQMLFTRAVGQHRQAA